MLYESVHHKLRRERGSASEKICACGAQARDWAYQHNGETLYCPDGRAYSENLDDYEAMCRSCHRTLDIQSTPSRYEEGNAGLARWAREYPEAAAARNVITSEGLARWRAENPEAAAELLQSNWTKGRETTGKRWKTDPEFAARRKAELVEGASRWRAENPEVLRERGRLLGLKRGPELAKIRRQCLGCGRISTPAGLGKHQKDSGHKGYETVSNEPKEDSA